MLLIVTVHSVYKIVFLWKYLIHVKHSKKYFQHLTVTQRRTWDNNTPVHDYMSRESSIWRQHWRLRWNKNPNGPRRSPESPWTFRCSAVVMFKMLLSTFIPTRHFDPIRDPNLHVAPKDHNIVENKFTEHENVSTPIWLAWYCLSGYRSRS